jgi:peroxiredoxin
MEMTSKLHPGQRFEPVTFSRLDGPDGTIGEPGKWQALFVFRGQHCPLCMTYLEKLEANRDRFETLGVEIAAVSADSEAQTRTTAAAARPGFPLHYGMPLETMQRLGLYVSEPRSAEETDHRFPEPALFVINPQGCLQIVDIANGPSIRPDLDILLRGLGSVTTKNTPPRGTWR